MRKDDEIDRVPLAGVDYVKALDEIGSIGQDSANMQSQDFYFIQVATNPEGYNSGRSYNLRTKSKEMHGEILALLNHLSKEARGRAKSANSFRKSQLHVKNVYDHFLCQYFIALVIVGVCAPNLVSKLVDFEKF